MSDTLSWLCFAREKALSEVICSQKESILPFLLGDAFSSHGYAASKTKRTEKKEQCCSGGRKNFENQFLCQCLPRFGTSSGGCSTHGMIPLAVVEESMFSVSSASAVHLLRQHFLPKSVDGTENEEGKNSWKRGVDGVDSEHLEKIHPTDTRCDKKENRFDEMFTVNVNGGQDKKNFLTDVSRLACLSSLEEYIHDIVEEASKRVTAIHDMTRRGGILSRTCYGSSNERSACNTEQQQDGHVSEGVRDSSIYKCFGYEDAKGRKKNAVSEEEKLTRAKRNPYRKRRRDRDEWVENNEREDVCDCNLVHSIPHIKVHRLLIVISCSCFSQSAYSLLNGGKGHLQHHHGGSAGGRFSITPSSLGRSLSSARQVNYHHQGGHPLYLFLSDLVALYNRTRIRLSTLAQLSDYWCDMAMHTNRSCFLPNSQFISTRDRVQLAVLLIPKDDLYGIAKLAQCLSPLFGNEYLIRCFDKTCLQITAEVPLSLLNSSHKEIGKNATKNAKKIQIPYDGRLIHHIILLWEPGVVPISYSSLDNAGAPCTNFSDMTKSYDDMMRHLILSESRFFFLRPNNLVLAWFLWHSFQLFPVLLFPSWLESLERLWASRHVLDDVVHAMHSLLMPFQYSTERMPSYGQTKGVEMKEKEKESLTALLDALYATASHFSVQVIANIVRSSSSASEFVKTSTNSEVKRDSSSASKGDIFGLNSTNKETFFFVSHIEAAFFLLLYEDLIYGRGSRLLGFPRIVQCLAAFSPGRLDKDFGSSYETPIKAKKENIEECTYRNLYTLASEVLSSGALPFLHRSSTSFCCCSSSSKSEESRNFLLPQYITAQYGSLAPFVGQQLQRAAAFCASPPFSSLEQLHASLQYSPSFPSLPSTSLSTIPFLPLPWMQPSRMSPNNFFSPFITPEIRLLHLLTSHALKTLQPKSLSSSRRRHRAAANSKASLLFVPLSQLQWAASLTDLSLISALEVLRSSGLIAVSPTEVAARSMLVVNPYSLRFSDY